MNKFWNLFLIILVAFQSCRKEDDAEPGSVYLIFGHYYGECFGEDCVETFKLTDTQLFEDINDHHGGAGPFSFQALGMEKFSLVRDLPGYIPEELLLQGDQVFGCPDCADQGGLVVWYTKNGKVKVWKIDTAKSNVPEYLHDFMDKLKEKISIINQ